LTILGIIGKAKLMDFGFRDFLQNGIWEINVQLCRSREIGLQKAGDGFGILVGYSTENFKLNRKIGIFEMNLGTWVQVLT